MTEAEWVEIMRERIASVAFPRARGVKVKSGLRIPYGFEITSYNTQPESKAIAFETDLAIIETDDQGRWKPRVIIEAKIRSVTTHDAITYSQKASAHKSVHPYLRYGIMLGERQHLPLPGRLYRHGAHFDFMISFVATTPTRNELLKFAEVLRAEVEASRTLEKMIYKSRSPTRDRYTLVHRKLRAE